MLVEMPELGGLEHRCAASLAGLAPIARDSGHHRGKRFIRGGRAHLRQAIYMPALVAVRFNADLKAKYESLRAAGKLQRSRLPPSCGSSLSSQTHSFAMAAPGRLNSLDQDGYSRLRAEPQLTQF